MPKQTDKLKQNYNRVTTEPEQSLSDDSDDEQHPQKQIPVGASIYWDIPGVFLAQVVDVYRCLLNPHCLKYPKPRQQTRHLTIHKL